MTKGGKELSLKELSKWISVGAGLYIAYIYMYIMFFDRMSVCVIVSKNVTMDFTSDVHHLLCRPR